MKERPRGFLSSDHINHDGEQFNYIVELHEYLWRIVRLIKPAASGSLDDFLDQAIDLIQAALKSGQAAEKGLERAVAEFIKRDEKPPCHDDFANCAKCPVWLNEGVTLGTDQTREQCWKQALSQPTGEDV